MSIESPNNHSDNPEIQQLQADFLFQARTRAKEWVEISLKAQNDFPLYFENLEDFVRSKPITDDLTILAKSRPELKRWEETLKPLEVDESNLGKQSLAQEVFFFQKIDDLSRRIKTSGKGQTKKGDADILWGKVRQELTNPGKSLPGKVIRFALKSWATQDHPGYDKIRLEKEKQVEALMEKLNKTLDQIDEVRSKKSEIKQKLTLSEEDFWNRFDDFAASDLKQAAISLLLFPERQDRIRIRFLQRTTSGPRSEELMAYCSWNMEAGFALPSEQQTSFNQWLRSFLPQQSKEGWKEMFEKRQFLKMAKALGEKGSRWFEKFLSSPKGDQIKKDYEKFMNFLLTYSRTLYTGEDLPYTPQPYFASRSARRINVSRVLVNSFLPEPAENFSYEIQIGKQRLPIQDIGQVIKALKDRFPLGSYKDEVLAEIIQKDLSAAVFNPIAVGGGKLKQVEDPEGSDLGKWRLKAKNKFRMNYDMEEDNGVTVIIVYKAGRKTDELLDKR